MLIECPKCHGVSCPVSGVSETQPIEHVCPHCHKVIQINPGGGHGASPTSPGVARRERTGKILVVDDTATIRAIAADILGSEGYQVLKAGDGTEALKRAHQDLPDLIVLDLVMPQMTGFDVIRELRKDPRHEKTPVLIMTGIVPGQDVRNDLRAYGITDFITKNHLTAALATRVAEILGRISEGDA
ncbi:MAG TPA: response regulator [Candidatus Polarisedimenticolia bacterium]|nr:response regulator [Candidatus Polarisedimenticolia bacterium]